MIEGSRVRLARLGSSTGLGTVDSILEVYEDEASNKVDPAYLVSWDCGDVSLYDRCELMEVAE